MRGQWSNYLRQARNDYAPPSPTVPLDAVIRVQQTPPHKQLLGLMQLTLHATRRTPQGASRLVRAMCAWAVKTRRAPSRHCREARVYGHTATAMHDIEYTPQYSSTTLYSPAVLCTYLAPT